MLSLVNQLGNTDVKERSNKVLVVDELGQLELVCNQGLTCALELLEVGPTPHFPHALIVVRKGLLPQLKGRFSLWGEPLFILPDEKSAELVMNAVLDNAY